MRALLERSYCRRLRLLRMRTKPPTDQSQLRHTATEAQKQHVNGEAREVYDFVPLEARGNQSYQ